MNPSPFLYLMNIPRHKINRHPKIFSIGNVMKNGEGFTLVEFILYIGIVGIVLLVAGAIGLNVLFGKAKLMTIEEVSQNARFALERISERVRNAEAINSPAPSTSASTLSLKMASSTQNPTIFDFSHGVIRITEGAGSTVNLTSSEIIVTNLQFSNISYPNTPGTLRIELRLKLVNPENRQEYNFEKTFYTTANIHKK